MTTALSDSELVKWMEQTRLTGNILTDRASNIGNLRRLAQRDEGLTFGVALDDHWDDRSLLSLMAERAGIDPRPDFERGQDRLSSERSLERLIAYGRRLGESVRSGDTILFATGHPAALLFVHAATAAAVSAAGGRVCQLHETLGTDRLLTVSGEDGGDVRQLASVCVRYRDGNLLHTHSPRFAVTVLDALDAAGSRPDLVVADHGWAGAAGARGIPTIGFADSNDPALFVAEAQGDVEVCVPMDDGLAGFTYGPVIDRILAEADLSC